MENINFKEIIEDLNQPIVVANNENKIIYANKLFFEISNFTNISEANQNLQKILTENENSINFNNNYYKITKTLNKNYVYLYFETTNDQLEKIYSEFISTVSHELRTPLTSIRGFADTMLMSYDKLDKNQFEKFLTIIKEQANRLIKLVENLLSISKIQVEQSNLIIKSVNPVVQIEKIIEILKNQYPNFTFDLNFSNNTANILVDENKFQQIIINLLDNAAKYSYQNGTININIGNSKENEDFVCIEIKDFGIGIEKENLKKIFEKFARIENHLTRKTQGSGLGLYIVKNLIEKMNAQISVQSSTQLPHSGTTFKLLFPAVSYTNQSKKILKGN